MSQSEHLAGAAPWVPATGGLDALARALDGCRGCDLWADAIQAVPGRGPSSARLGLVGEQPGDIEDQEGEPFVGPAGQVLDSALEQAGLSRSEVYLTNAVKHFRHEGTRGTRRLHRSPDRGQIRACGPWLDAELERLRPIGVVLLGAVAISAVLGSAARVGRDRGRLLEWPRTRPLRYPPIWIVVTTHPAAVLRAEDRDAVMDGLVADLVVARAALSAPSSWGAAPAPAP